MQMHTSGLPFTQLMQVIEHQKGIVDVACPLCGPDRRSASNRIRKVMRVWNLSPGFIGYACARCGETGYARDRNEPRVNSVIYTRVQTELAQRHREAAAMRRAKALRLWRSRKNLQGSIAETYLRDARAYRGSLPPTLGFLPARADYPPALIAAFGLPVDESKPDIPDNRIAGVHLTRLMPDGCDRDRGDKAKIMIGFSKGNPIMLAPWTDGLALIVTEGIEDALSTHESTGLCAWAAGSASRLPAIVEAVPSWIDCVTIVADHDRDGYRYASALATALSSRNVEARLIVLGAAEKSAA